MPVITSHRWKESPAFATPSHTKLSLLRMANIAFLLLLSAFGNGGVALATTSVGEEKAPKNKNNSMVSQRQLEDESYLLMDKGSAGICPGYQSVSKEECMYASRLVFSGAINQGTGGNLNTGSWNFTPCGCMIWYHSDGRPVVTYKDPVHGNCKKTERGRPICHTASTEALHPNTVVHVDFSDLNSPSNSHTPQLMNGAQTQSCAGIGYDCNTLRIDRDGPYALIRDVDIGPTAMPECTLIIGVRLESKANRLGWIFGHEQSGYDRTILMHDYRFGGGVASAVGKTWQPYSPPKSTPLHEWLHVTAVFKQGGPSWVYVNGVRSDNSVIATNSDGMNDLWIGRPHHGGHWADSWIKHVTVMNKVLSDFEVNSYSTKFFEEMEDLKYGEPTANPSLSPSEIPSQIPSQTPTISSESASCDDPNSVENGSSLGDCICFNGFNPDIHDGSCTPEEDIENVPKLKIAIEDTEMYASFDGSYGSEPADGTFVQDFGGGVVGGPQEDAIRIFGNAWKAYKLPQEVSVTKFTMVQFEFESSQDVEGNALCLDENKNEDTYGGLQTRCIAIVMNNDINQVEKWNNVKRVVRNDSGLYTVNVGSLFNDQAASINFLGFIQDNDTSPTKGRSTFSSIKIYEDTTSSNSKALSWKFIGGNHDVNVSTHSNLVSVSEDGQTAIYGSGGNVHLVKKGSTAHQKVSFDLTLISSVKEIAVNGVTNLGVCQGDCDRDTDCIGDLKCFQRNSESTQTFYIPGCFGNPNTEWDYCYDPNTPTPDPVVQFKDIAVDGKTNLGLCQGDCDRDTDCIGDLKCFQRDNTMPIPGCDGASKASWDYCYNPDTIPRLTPTTWTDYYLLHTYPTTNNCPSGTEVSQTECHLAGIAVGMQTKWDTLDWKKFIVHSSSSKPCGCYIDNETTISYNTRSSCGPSSSTSRLVCKPTNPTRTADIVLARPSAIASGKGFGNGSKVLSDNANTIAIAAPSANQVAIYTIDGSTPTFRQVVDGYNPSISGDGFAVGTISKKASALSDCIVSIYGKTDSSVFVETEMAVYDFTCDSVDDGIDLDHHDNNHILHLDTKQGSYNLSCNVPNSRLITGLSDSPIVCMCNDGYVNSGPKSGKILEDGYSCISSLHAKNVVVTSDSIQFKISTETANDYTETKLEMRASPNDVEIKLTSRKLIKVDSDNMKVYTLSQLDPGSRYTVTLSNTNDSSQRLSFPAVTTCSCGDGDIDKTGRPKDVQVVQNNGHVIVLIIRLYGISKNT